MLLAKILCTWRSRDVSNAELQNPILGGRVLEKNFPLWLLGIKSLKIATSQHIELCCFIMFVSLYLHLTKQKMLLLFSADLAQSLELLILLLPTMLTTIFKYSISSYVIIIMIIIVLLGVIITIGLYWIISYHITHYTIWSI